ncbi:YjbQ family protein [Sphingomonas sp. HDW15A]|uniref:secondary thiamine-phosphate synthase enzyme YjbQ n=1 Tax=Sphingomonas sp. HDW15A TaxID=2714942 RepID=UPI00140D94E8|nr:secondary thiamine-phosphate synthase enzyme YjbQ [Sphingomonas sp. HDW15A]QIK95705.1 YjbQ family protein [Sphingomonas sp. HDW15A]
MRQSHYTLLVETHGKGLVDITAEVKRWVADQGMSDGLLTLFCRHTSASLLIQENAAPAARRDLEVYFERVAPENAGYEHDDEGSDDMPAHIRSALTPTSVTIPLLGGGLVLGTWQGIFLFEHRRSAHRRMVVLHLMGN